MKKIYDVLTKYPVSSSLIINSSCPTIEIPIYIINLISNVARKNYITYMMKKLNINYHMITVDIVTHDIHSEIGKSKNKGVVGCFLSHMWCINDAITNNYLNFIIFEDDVVFHKDFTKLLKCINYSHYDMLQLGCSDFNLKDNLCNIHNDFKKGPIVYNPRKLALGAFGNLYNVNFAKILFYEKLVKFEEFDTKFDMYYEKYNIGICFPNLVIADLSTTNLEHDFSIFSCKKNRHGYYVSNCFINFEYADYYFIWIVFLEQCHSYLKSNNIKLLSYEDYLTNIEVFSKLTKSIDIKHVLLTNGLEHSDINEMICC